MCKIYSDPNWIYVLDNIEKNDISSLNIRSSDDNTGNVIFDGDWTLESESVDVQMVRLYFNELILELDINLLLVQASINTIVSVDQQRLFFAGYGINSANNDLNFTEDYFRPCSYVGNENNPGFNVLDSDEKIIHLVNGDYQWMFSTSKNKCYTFGTNTYGTLGINNSNYSFKTFLPQPVQFENGEDILSQKQIKLLETDGNGGNDMKNLYILFEDGTIYGTGQNSHGQLGETIPLGSTTNVFKEVVFTYDDPDEYAIRIGGGHACLVILTNKFTLYSVGQNKYGITGRGTVNGTSTLGKPIFNGGNPLANGEYPVFMFVQNQCFVVTNIGNLYGCGYNGNATLGIGSINNQVNLKRAYFPNGFAGIKQFYMANAAAYIRDNNDKYYVAGGGNQFRTLLNTRYNRGTFTLNNYLPSIINNYHIRHINGVGNGNTLITEANEVFSWGNTSTNNKLALNIGDNITNRWPLPTYAYNGSTYFVEGYFGNGYTTLLNEEDLAIWNTQNVPSVPFTLLNKVSYNFPDIEVSDPSLNTVLNFDVGVEYNSDISLIVPKGLFQITNVPSNRPLAVLNHGQETSIQYGGSYVEESAIAPDGNTYNYYSGNFYINVDASFSTISFHTTAGGGSYLGTQDKIAFDIDGVVNFHDIVTIDEAEPIIQELNLDTYDNSSNYFKLFKDSSANNYFFLLSDTVLPENEISGNLYRNYQIIDRGNFFILNVPEQFPIALIQENNGSIVNNNVIISADMSNSSVHSISGVDTTFFHGDVQVKAPYGITGELKAFVYNSLNSSVVEMKNTIGFQAKYVLLDPDSSSTVKLPYTSYFQFFDTSNGDLLIRFNSENELSGNFYDKYIISQPGIYEVLNIPERYEIAFYSTTAGFVEDIIGSSTTESQERNVDGIGPLVFYTNGDVRIKIGEYEDASIFLYVYDNVEQSIHDLQQIVDASFMTFNANYQENTRICMNLDVPEFFEQYKGYTVLNLHPQFSSENYDQGIDFGIYKNQTYVINVPNEYPIAIVTKEQQTNDLSYSGYTENQDGFVTVRGIQYPLYHGPVFFMVHDDLSATNTITFYTKSGYDLNTSNAIIYDSSCAVTPGTESSTEKTFYETDFNIQMIISTDLGKIIPETVILNDSTTVNHVFSTDSSINEKETFSANQTWNVFPGNSYSIRNVPPWFPITVLNGVSSEWITLTGDSSKMTTIDVSGISYDFYYGDVSLNIISTFHDVSGFSLFSTYGGGKLVGSENMITMKNIIEPLRVVSDLKIFSETQNSTTENYYSLNNKVYHLTGYNYGVYIGTYLIRNIPEQYALAILNSGYESSVHYTGTDLKGSYEAPDGNTYDFYHGTVTLIIKDLSGVVDKSFSICCFDGNYMGGENIIKILDNNFYNVMDQNVITDLSENSFISSIDLFPDITFIDSSSNEENTIQNPSIRIPEIPSTSLQALQIEFIAPTPSNHTDGDLWQATYVKPGSGGSSVLTYSDINLNYRSDDTGNYYIITETTNGGALLENYPNQAEFLEMDLDGSPGITFEIWAYYDGQDGTDVESTRGWLMGFETGWGPYIAVQDSRLGSIGTTPGATDNNTYSNLVKPGYISDSQNRGKLLHLIGYWKRQGSYFIRGMYINGVHYPQENTSQSGYGDFPYFDSYGTPDQYRFTIGELNIGNTQNLHNCIGVRVYSFRIWHTLLESSTIEKLYNVGPNQSIVVPDDPILNEGQNTTSRYSYYVECLTQESSANAVSVSNESIILLNGETQYKDNDSLRFYSVFDGSYTITGIADASNAIAILNHDVSSHIVYTGEILVGSRTSVYENATNNVYDFYSGNVVITVNSGFTSPLLIERWDASLNSSVLLTKIIYSDLCDPAKYKVDEVPVPTTPDEPEIVYQCLPESSNLIITYDTNNDARILLNAKNNNEYIPDRLYGMGIGSYLITNIPDTHPIAIFNHDISDSVTYIGDKLMTNTRNLSDLKNYDYYSGNLRITVTSLPSDISFMSFGVAGAEPNSSLFETNKILFTETCEPAKAMVFECLRTYSSISPNTGNSQILINSHSYTVTDKRQVGVSLGFYQFQNISKANPIAFIHSGSISTTPNASYDYFGVDFNKITSSETIQNLDLSINIPAGLSFYSGDVTLRVKNEPTDDLYVIMKISESIFLYQKLYFTRYCDYEGSKIDITPRVECLNSKTNMILTTKNNGKARLVFNGDEAYVPSKLYGVSVGTYLIQNVDFNNAIRISNENIQGNDVFLSSPNEEIVQFTRNNVDYDYYFGDVLLNVTTDISYLTSGISLDIVGNGDFDGESTFIYTDECHTDDSYYIECLNTEQTISHDQSGQIIFNDHTQFDYDRRFGLFIGNYYFRDVSSASPVAFLNNDISDIITYSGTQSHQVHDVNGVSYEFFSGDITVTVKGDFTKKQMFLSAAILNDVSNIIFTTDKLTYSEVCQGSTPGYYIEPLATDLSFSVKNNKIVLSTNDAEKYDATKKYGLFVGTYVVRAVPESNPIAIINTGYENKIAMTGEYLFGTKVVESVSVDQDITSKEYNFYYGDVTIYVFEPFEIDEEIDDKVFLSLYDYNLGFLGTENQIIYDKNIGSLNTLEYTICLNENSKCKLFKNENTGEVNYTFNDAEAFFDYKKYGLHIGSYIIQNVPLSSPLAFLNHDISHMFTYSGAPNKKIRKTGPDANEYDFYFGDINITVTGDFGQTSPVSIDGNFGGCENKFVFATQCETDGFAIQCLQNDVNLSVLQDNNITFDQTQTYNPYIKHALYIGNYIVSLAENISLAVLNTDISDSVTAVGFDRDAHGTFIDTNGLTYTLFTREVRLLVKKSFKGYLPMVVKNTMTGVTNNIDELVVFSDRCDKINKSREYTVCLSQVDTEQEPFISSVRAMENDQISLDISLISIYDPLQSYGVYLGNYIFDIPEEFPIAFLNNGIEDSVTYTGDVSKSYRTAGPFGDKIYTFYYGKVILNILKPFTSDLRFSFYLKGFLGGSNKVKFTTFCEPPVIADTSSNYSIECVTTKSQFRLIQTDIYGEVAMLNNNTKYSVDKTYSMSEGVYIITGIPAGYSLALLNKGKESLIDYSGDPSHVEGLFSIPNLNESMLFYNTQITIVVSGNFSVDENLSFYMHCNEDNTLSGYYGLDHKLKYSNICEFIQEINTNSQETLIDNNTLSKLSFGSLSLNDFQKAGNDSVV